MIFFYFIMCYLSKFCIFARQNKINMAPKKIRKESPKTSASKPKKRFKYIKIVELVEDPYNLR